MHDGLRVVAEGLNPGEKIIIDGLQRVRPGSVVSPKPGDMHSRPGESVAAVTAKESAKKPDHAADPKAAGQHGE